MKIRITATMPCELLVETTDDGVHLTVERPSPPVGGSGPTMVVVQGGGGAPGITGGSPRAFWDHGS
jgi:hypothetical protein